MYSADVDVVCISQSSDLFGTHDILSEYANTCRMFLAAKQPWRVQAYELAGICGCNTAVHRHIDASDIARLDRHSYGMAQ
jgi:hypothetical protein